MIDGRFVDFRRCALQQLSEAGEVNQRLFEEIRAIELRYIQEEEAIRKKLKGKRP